MLSASSEMAMRYIFFTYRKEQMFMKKEIRIPAYKRIWCKIRYCQQLNDITNETLAKYLNVSVRTLSTYDKDAKNLTLGSIDSFLYNTGLSLEQLNTL